MNLRIRVTLLGLLLSFCLGSVLSGSTPKTIFVVRHAEKQSGPDPELSELGTANAAALAETMRAIPLDSVWSTDTKRTRNTGLPTATEHERALTIYDVRGGVDTAMQNLAERLLAGEGGERVLVIGHSNTGPILMRALGAEDAPDLTDREYGDLFILVDPGTPQMSWSRLSFGDSPRE
jgi:broad specificity phosphatase PhoE